MKTLLILLIAALTLNARADVDALGVAKIATDYLAKRGAGSPKIVSITLDSGAMIKGRKSWLVRWSSVIEEGGSREIGLRVNLDGSIARIVEGKKGTLRPPSPFGVR